MPECRLCGAPGGYPFCNDACRQAAPDDDTPIHDPLIKPPPTDPTQRPF
ncbi:hypothetical protein KVH31_34715 [Streptomyces olivaceus]|nr:hypothetical protein [Streptomyces olivaceus]MBZ6211651.1 hypothetical protein [Streptomyces olivaceus]